MMYCDIQTSVLDIYKCLGVSYETVFKKCSVFCIQVEPGKKATILQAHLKKFNSAINTCEELHLSHMDMET